MSGNYAVRRPAAVRGARVALGDARRELRDVRAGVRADGAHAARAGRRGVPEFREVRDQALGPRAAGQPARPDLKPQPGAAGKPGTSARLEPALPSHPPRPAAVLL